MPIFHEIKGKHMLNFHEIEGKYMQNFHEIEDIVTVSTAEFHFPKLFQQTL